MIAWLMAISTISLFAANIYEKSKNNFLEASFKHPIGDPYRLELASEAKKSQKYSEIALIIFYTSLSVIILYSVFAG